LRVNALTTPKSALSLRRGGELVTLEPDVQMQVKAAQDKLERLNAKKAESLELVVSGDAAGSVIISHSKIKFTLS
jgi:hypothetical protein